MNMTLNNFNEEDGRIVSTDIRKIGNCSLTICTLQNGRRINLFIDGKGGYRIWTFLCNNFCAGMWPTVIQLAEVLSPNGIKLEVTSELDLCCFFEGVCDMNSRGINSLETALEQFIFAVTNIESYIVCLYKKPEKGAV